MTTTVRAISFVLSCGAAATISWQFPPTVSEEQRRILVMRQSFRSAITEARSDAERLAVTYEARIMDHMLRFGSLTSLVRLDGGIDQFEATALAWAYTALNPAACTYRGFPDSAGDFWSFSLTIGKGAEAGPPILVHRTTGAVSHHGQFSALDPFQVLRAFEQWPNKAPEPTPTSVMPAAKQPSRRP